MGLSVRSACGFSLESCIADAAVYSAARDAHLGDCLHAPESNRILRPCRRASLSANLAPDAADVPSRLRRACPVCKRAVLWMVFAPDVTTVRCASVAGSLRGIAYGGHVPQHGLSLLRPGRKFSDTNWRLNSCRSRVLHQRPGRPWTRARPGELVPRTVVRKGRVSLHPVITPSSFFKVLRSLHPPLTSSCDHLVHLTCHLEYHFIRG